MAPPRKPWFRFYTEALTDPKLRRLTPEERWLWVAVLGAARRSPMPGWLMITDSLAMEADDLAELAGMTAARVEKGLAKMVGLGIVVQSKEGTYRVTKWAERQFESDDTTKRTTKHRSKNADAATKERSNVDDVTPPETDDRVQRTETEVPVPSQPDDDSVAREPGSSSDDRIWQVWLTYAGMVADHRSEKPKNRQAFITKVALDAQRERHDRLMEYLRIEPDAIVATLAQWLFEDADPLALAANP